MLLLRMVFVFSVIVFLALLAGGHQLGLYVGPWFTIGALVASPFVSAAAVLGIVYLADWSDRRARAKRRASRSQ